MRVKIESVSEYSFDMTLETTKGDKVKLNNHQLTLEQYTTLKNLVEEIVEKQR